MWGMVCAAVWLVGTCLALAEAKPVDGKWYEFGYYEYTGKDFEGDWGFQWPRG
jgi:hypothetical protein